MKTLLATAAVFVTLTAANASENYPEWRHANREQGCKVLDTILSGFADPANCQNIVASMEIGPDEKAFKTCLISVGKLLPNEANSNRLPRYVADTLLVGCSMLGYGMGEETAKQFARNVPRR